MVEIRFTEPFQKRVKKLTKRYRSIQQYIELEPILQQLQEGLLVGEQITDVNATVFKVRAKNSDIPTGKSGGYRLIYQVISPLLILLLVIYAKSDQVTISSTEIKRLFQETRTYAPCDRNPDYFVGVTHEIPILSLCFA